MLHFLHYCFLYVKKEASILKEITHWHHAAADFASCNVFRKFDGLDCRLKWCREVSNN